MVLGMRLITTLSTSHTHCSIVHWINNLQNKKQHPIYQSINSKISPAFSISRSSVNININTPRSLIASHNHHQYSLYTTIIKNLICLFIIQFWWHTPSLISIRTWSCLILVQLFKWNKKINLKHMHYSSCVCNHSPNTSIDFCLLVSFGINWSPFTISLWAQYIL